MIPWDDASTQVILNPRLPTADAERVHALIAHAGPLAELIPLNPMSHEPEYSQDVSS